MHRVSRDRRAGLCGALRLCSQPAVLADGACVRLADTPGGQGPDHHPLHRSRPPRGHLRVALRLHNAPGLRGAHTRECAHAGATDAAGGSGACAQGRGQHSHLVQARRRLQGVGEQEGKVAGVLAMTWCSAVPALNRTETFAKASVAPKAWQGSSLPLLRHPGNGCDRGPDNCVH